MPDNVTRPVFGPPGFFTWENDGTKRIVGLDEAESEEIVALVKANLGGNPFRDPRYRELFEKYHSALMAKAFGTETEK